MILFLLIFFIYARREDSVIFILCRNEDKSEIIKTLRNFEKVFNKKYRYPYVFLNDKDWEENFKNEVAVAIGRDNAITFSKIAPEDWNPSTPVTEEMKNNWKSMAGVPYYDSVSYRNMCRFFSRKFYKHPAVMKYKYYWRIEPGVTFENEIEYDPFEYMEKHQLKYGFTITILEFMNTIPTLWPTTKEFMNNNNINRSSMGFMFDDNDNYNGCHFWSNFEIGSFEFLRSSNYNKYVDFLEKKNGFYLERWGDAPVHSLAVALFLDKSKVHFFEDIGYTHPPYTHCPKDCGIHPEKCTCKPENSIDFKGGSCLKRYLQE